MVFVLMFCADELAHRCRGRGQLSDCASACAVADSKWAAKKVYSRSVLFAAFKSAVASPMKRASDRYMLYLNAGRSGVRLDDVSW